MSAKQETITLSGQEAWFMLVGKYRSEGMTFQAARDRATKEMVEANCKTVTITYDPVRIMSYLGS